MLKTDAERMSFTKQILQELTEQSGGPWKEVWCEPQPQFDEMVFWVLLYEDSDLKETHRVFCDILARHVDNMRPLQAALAYHKLTDEGVLLVESMVGNETVFASLSKNELGTVSYEVREGKSVYRSNDSKR